MPVKNLQHPRSIRAVMIDAVMIDAVMIDAAGMNRTLRGLPS